MHPEVCSRNRLMGLGHMTSFASLAKWFSSKSRQFYTIFENVTLFSDLYTVFQDHNITMEAMECLDEQVEKEIHGAPTKVSHRT